MTARAVEAAVLDGRATDLEEVVEAIVLGATLATGGDYAMSSGIRDLSQLEGGDIEPVLDLKKGDFFCCVLPTPGSPRTWRATASRRSCGWWPSG